MSASPRSGTRSRAGGSRFAPGLRMKAFLVGKRKGRGSGAAETKAEGGGGRPPAARSPGSSRAAGGNDAGGGALRGGHRTPTPLSEGTSVGPLGKAGAGPPTPAQRPEGQRGRGTPEPLLRPRHPASGPPDPLSLVELGLCRRARPRPHPSAPLSEAPSSLLAPSLQTQNPESSLGFHPGSDTPKSGVLGQNLARLPGAPHLCSVRAEEPWEPPALQALCVPSSLRPQPASHIARAATALRRRHRARAGHRPARHRPGLRKTLARGFQAASAGVCSTGTWLGACGLEAGPRDAARRPAGQLC